VPVRTLETVTVLVPSVRLDTDIARGLIPADIAHPVAAENSARAGLLIHGLVNDASALFDATDDRLHQEFRRSAYPQSMDLVDALRDRGLPAVISGAGPTVLVLADSVPETAVPDGVVCRRTAIDLGGYRVIRES
jgi:homoserine kinase